MGLGLLCAASWVKRLGGGEERFDRFVAENEERAIAYETLMLKEAQTT
jgi:hypothetical protein